PSSPRCPRKDESLSPPCEAHKGGDQEGVAGDDLSCSRGPASLHALLLEAGSPPQLRRGMLGRGPSGGGCRLNPSASIRRPYELSNLPRPQPPAAPCPRP